MLSSPGCWKRYGEVLAKEYLPENYNPDVRRITADTYAVQHAGQSEERRAVQSVNGHLVSLYLKMEKSLSGEQATLALKRLLEDNRLVKQLRWLEPPSFENTLTVADVVAARDWAEHERLVRAWGRSVWEAWKAQHLPAIGAIAGSLLRG
jgi:glycine betaine/choline ABC-type transport system substrate-binding protein